MKTIVYPGFSNQECRAQYGVHIKKDRAPATADVVVINCTEGKVGTSLWNTQIGREVVTKEILTKELHGLSPQHIRVFFLIDARPSGVIHGIELPIGGGDSDFDKRRHLPIKEITGLCAAVDYAGPRAGLPGWLTEIVSSGASGG